jgi:hypothetical protein
MKLTRALLLSVASLSLIAALLPAAAQANGPYWFKGGVKVGDAKNKVTFKTTGNVKYTLNKSGVTVGPCKEVVGGQVWNEPANGVDTTTSHTYTTPCPTSIAGCEIESVKATKLPWPSKLVFVGTAIEDRTENVEIDFTFQKVLACGALGGMTDTASGTYASRWNPGKNCSTYDESLEELLFEGSPVKVSGEDCTTTESGESITAE